MTPLIAFALKILDNGLSTAKTIYINKEKYCLGALLNAFSTFFYLVAIVQLTKSNSLISIIAMCLATFIGTYLPGLIIKKSERDKIYIFDVTASTLDKGKEFADTIRDNNIAIKTYSSYDTDMNKVLSCKIYCTSRHESRVVNNTIPQDFKYNVYVPLAD